MRGEWREDMEEEQQPEDQQTKITLSLLLLFVRCRGRCRGRLALYKLRAGRSSIMQFMLTCVCVVCLCLCFANDEGEERRKEKDEGVEEEKMGRTDRQTDRQPALLLHFNGSDDADTSEWSMGVEYDFFTDFNYLCRYFLHCLFDKIKSI